MITYQKSDLLIGEELKITESVKLHVPTVRDVIREKKYAMYTQPLMISTRQMFSSLAEVDKLEAEFPNVWKMSFHEEGTQILGQMMGYQTGTQLIIEALSFWTKLEIDSFTKLSNGKIVNEKANWIIDEQGFHDIVNVIKDITGYEDDEDLIAPRNMSKRQLGIWEKLYAGRTRSRNKESRTIADKIVILQISNNSFIPLKEIEGMTVYHFNKLYEAVAEKDAAEKQWDLKMSPKFDSGKGKFTSWQEKFKLEK